VAGQAQTGVVITDAEDLQGDVVMSSCQRSLG